MKYLTGLGVGLDQSPHYFSISSKYREANPETSIGKAGDLSQVGQLCAFKNILQGVNTGVALYSLAGMRASEEYKRQVNKESDLGKVIMSMNRRAPRPRSLSQKSSCWKEQLGIRTG